MINKLTILVGTLTLASGCSEYIDYESIATCKSVSSDILKKVEFNYLPELKNIDALDEYYSFVEENHPIIKRKSEELLECMRDSKFVVKSEDVSSWSTIGVGTLGLVSEWEYGMSEKESKTEEDLEYLVKSSISDIEFILGK